MPTGIYQRKPFTAEHKTKLSEANKGKHTYLRDYHFTDADKLKMSESKLAEKNPIWKGDAVGLTQLHVWVRARITKPKVCSDCEQPKKLDLANISQSYLRDLSDWEWLCRRCHMIKDQRMLNLINYNANTK